MLEKRMIKREINAKNEIDDRKRKSTLKEITDRKRKSTMEEKSAIGGYQRQKNKSTTEKGNQREKNRTNDRKKSIKEKGKQEQKN